MQLFKMLLATFQIDKELEDQKIRSVMGEGVNEDGLVDGPSVDFKQSTERDAPIKLPMGDIDKCMYYILSC